MAIITRLIKTRRFGKKISSFWIDLGHHYLEKGSNGSECIFVLNEERVERVVYTKICCLYPSLLTSSVYLGTNPFRESIDGFKSERV